MFAHAIYSCLSTGPPRLFWTERGAVRVEHTNNVVHLSQITDVYLVSMDMCMDVFYDMSVVVCDGGMRYHILW